MKTITLSLTEEEVTELETAIAGKLAANSAKADSIRSLVLNPKTPTARSTALRAQHKTATHRCDALEKLLTALRAR